MSREFGVNTPVQIIVLCAIISHEVRNVVAISVPHKKLRFNKARSHPGFVLSDPFRGPLRHTP